MQRVSALLPTWDRSRQPAHPSGKNGGALDKVFGWADKLAHHPPNKQPGADTSALTTRFGREHYWPTNLDRECEKAARVLKSFCTDGYLANDERGSAPTSPTLPGSPRTPLQSMKKIPPRIIQNAVGLAVFSCMRSGLWMSGSGGSGILIARKADGTWSPPSGFLLHTAALGFVIGVDIYDCVLVINSVAALEMFTRPKITLGTDMHLTVGPLISAGQQQYDLKWKELENTVLTYLKAKGQHRAVNIDGSLVTERGNENERFYGANIPVMDILAGAVRKDIPEIRPLYEVIKAAEGRTDFDAALLEQLSMQPAPGDAVIETPTLTPVSPRPAFGVPDNEDPDPFGVIALEMAGLEIREAGTRLRPTSTQFEYNPSPTSPLFGKFNRESVGTFVSRSNRGSYMSTKTQASRVTDAGTQTDVAETPDTTPSPVVSEDGRDRASLEKTQVIVHEPEEIDYTKVDMSALKHLSEESLEVPQPHPGLTPEKNATPAASAAVTSDENTAATTRDAAQGDAAEESTDFQESERDEDADDEDDEDEDFDGEEPVVFEIAAAAQPTRAAIMSSQVTQVIQAKGALVTIPKRIPPPLPVRSPARTSRASNSEFGDVLPLRSPLRNSLPNSIRDENEKPAEKEESTQTSSPEALTVEAAKRLEPFAHHRNSSSVYTTVLENRLSIDESIPRTPSTFQTNGHTSSGEDDREPHTPKPEDDIEEKRPRQESIEKKDEMEMGTHNETTITVASANSD